MEEGRLGKWTHRREKERSALEVEATKGNDENTMQQAFPSHHAPHFVGRNAYMRRRRYSSHVSRPTSSPGRHRYTQTHTDRHATRKVVYCKVR